MKKQTAVEWLEYKLANTPTEELVFRWRNIFDQAKAMEKEQIIAANEDCSTNELGELFTGEQYYNETYGN
jgi:hypothetical protein